MADLRERDVRDLLELVSESHSLTDLDDFRAGVLPPLRRVVPCEVASYNEVVPGDHAIAILDPHDALDSLAEDPEELFARVSASNPLIQRHMETRDGRPYKFSDFISSEELHRREIYRELYAQLGIEYQMAFALPSEPSLVIGIALSACERDFTERDRHLLSLARPHLIQAYRNAQLYTVMRRTIDALERGLDAAGDGVVALDRQGRVLTMTPAADAALAAGFGRSTRGAGLPDELDRWVVERRGAARGNVQAVAQPLVVPSGAGHLLVRFLPARQPGEGDTLLVETVGEPLPVQSLEALGLTRREAEVLRRVALGDSNKEAAAHLAISAQTVGKHLERAFRKLGVTSRVGAAATAWAGATAASGLR